MKITRVECSLRGLIDRAHFRELGPDLGLVHIELAWKDFEISTQDPNPEGINLLLDRGFEWETLRLVAGEPLWVLATDTAGYDLWILVRTHGTLNFGEEIPVGECESLTDPVCLCRP